MFRFDNNRGNKRKFWGVRPTIRKILERPSQADSFMNRTHWTNVTNNKR